MAGPGGISGFFELEWARFWEGLDKLSPEQQQLELQRRAQVRARAGQQNTVTLPGWDDVIHLAPRYVPTAAERSEYFTAQRAGRSPNLAPDVAAAIQQRSDRARAMATSAAPPYAAAWGQMLTALDNVQDFTTTVATLGRLALWPAIRALDAALPRFAEAGWARSTLGATTEAAEAIAQQAARAAAADAYKAGLTRTAAELAAAAGAGLERSSLMAAGREAAALAAGAAARTAYASALTKAGAGIGARLLGRLIPGLGYILLVGDLINLLTWLGQIGMIGYAGACFGLPRGLAAAGPQLALRGLGAQGPCGIKGKLSALGDLNPFSQTRRGARNLRLARATPTLGNLLEVAQTTDQIYGIGLSFGGLVGAMTETAYAAELQARGEPVSRGTGSAVLQTGGITAAALGLQFKSKALGAVGAGALLADVVGRTATAPLRQKHSAAQQLQNAPIINGTQETFTEYEHIEQLVNYVHALDLVGSDLAGINWQDQLAAQLPVELTPPAYYDPFTADLIARDDPQGHTLGRWPLPGNPRTITSTEFLEWGATAIPAGMKDFLVPRRNDALGMFAGGLYTLITEKVFDVLEPGGNFLEARWSPEWRALLALAETGRLVNVNVDPAQLWAWWLDAVNLAEQKSLQHISGPDLDATAARHGVELIRVEEPYLRIPAR